MKSTFLAVSAPITAGQTKVTFKDVNGGDGLNEFRAGSQKGDVILDFYGGDSIPVVGKTYILTLEEYDENAIDQNIAPVAAAPVSTPTPLNVAFNALVTVGVDETGAPTLSIDATPVAAPAAETEDPIDTQDNKNSDISGGDQGILQSVQSDVQTGDVQENAGNTQDNAGPAAGAENNEAGANLVNNTDTQSDGVGGAAQVS